MVAVVALDAASLFAKEEWWAGDEKDPTDGKHCEDAVPDCTPLLQEDPGQEGRKDGITGRRRQ